MLCNCFVQLTGQCKDISRHLATPVYAWLIVCFKTLAGMFHTLQAFPSADEHVPGLMSPVLSDRRYSTRLEISFPGMFPTFFNDVGIHCAAMTHLPAVPVWDSQSVLMRNYNPGSSTKLCTTWAFHN